MGGQKEPQKKTAKYILWESKSEEQSVLISETPFRENCIITGSKNHRDFTINTPGF